jgi:transposase
MPNAPLQHVATLGIDIGKNSFHLIGLDARGAIVLRQKLSRGQVEQRLANMPTCLIGMEACVGAHHLSRQLLALGHDVKLIPAQFVKPFRKSHKNDFRDAEAIAEAVLRPTMRFVPTKTVEQLDLQALHRVRARLVSQRTAVINQIRTFLLERGIAVRQGLRSLRQALPDILSQRTDVLTPRMVRLIEGLIQDWHHLDERIDAVTGEIEDLVAADEACQRLMSVPAPDERARRGTDHRQRHGGRRWEWRRLPARTRLRRLARAGAEADLNRRPHDPGPPVEARQ